MPSISKLLDKLTLENSNSSLDNLNDNVDTSLINDLDLSKIEFELINF